MEYMHHSQIYTDLKACLGIVSEPLSAKERHTTIPGLKPLHHSMLSVSSLVLPYDPE